MLTQSTDLVHVSVPGQMGCLGVERTAKCPQLPNHNAQQVEGLPYNVFAGTQPLLQEV